MNAIIKSLVDNEKIKDYLENIKQKISPINLLGLTDVGKVQFLMATKEETKEMLDAFEWLGKDKAYEYVITNPNKINELIEYCYPIKDKLYPPSIPDSDDQLRNKCYENAHKMYGENLPEKALKAKLNEDAFGNETGDVHLGALVGGKTE